MSDQSSNSSNSSNSSISSNSNNINKVIPYPEYGDPEFQNKIYSKREFYSNKIPTKSYIKDYSDVKKYREKICTLSVTPFEHQAFLSNYINPNTNYTGLLVMHGLGTGKTCAAIQIAEKFKSLVQKYNTKIVVIVTGPLMKNNWINELKKCTGDAYLKKPENVYLPSSEISNLDKIALINISQYYRFMSYKSFYKKVLGEKIKEETISTSIDNGTKIRVKHKKNIEGEYERDISIDKISSLDNTLLIVDEAHHLTGNMYGDALKKILKNSVNLKLVLLTATPMKNYADDIIELVNFLRPVNSPITRDKVFTSNYDYRMDFKEGGQEYLKRMTLGYVSYLRGQDPLVFAERIDKGTIDSNMLFTKLIRCKMQPFQQRAYDSTVLLEEEDSLNKRSQAVANFAFPGLDQKNNLVGYYGNNGILIVKSQLITKHELINKKIASEILNIKSSNLLLEVVDNGKTISGKIFELEYLKHFSIKFYTALTKLNRLVEGDKGSKLAFVYSNLVKSGIDVFSEILVMNGYLKYEEDSSNYKIASNTRCYLCGLTLEEHASSSSKIKKKHDFFPATFLSVTGAIDEESEIVSTDKIDIIKNIFNSPQNSNGRHIKLILGSMVMNEGISLKNIAEVHILDVYYNLGKIDQVVGRAIRVCSHKNIISDENRYPEVSVYKYVVTLSGTGSSGKLSSEEDIYKKAELKYLLIKRVERALKEASVDCPLNRTDNIFPDELVKYKDCYQLNSKENINKDTSNKESSNKDSSNKNLCPAKCDFLNCEYLCDDKILNKLHWDPINKVYKKISKENLDNSTFNQELARTEINIIKNKIKDMYILNYVYILEEILEYIKNSDSNAVNEKKDLFDPFFVFKALDELIPVTENDFNNFNSPVHDKFNRSGYIIFVNKYYIFQPFDQPEDASIYYRITYNKPLVSEFTVYNYIKNSQKYLTNNNKEEEYATNLEHIELKLNKFSYNFDLDYYLARDENKYVGIIDREPIKKKNILTETNIKDIFKIRERRSAVLVKKRATGVTTYLGSVCNNSKTREYLIKVAKNLGLGDIAKNRDLICDAIRDKLLELEKYSIGKDKLTYMIIPSNHQTLPFPYNLEDRMLEIKKRIKDTVKKLNIEINSKKKNLDSGTFEYIITLDSGKGGNLDIYANFLKDLGAVYNDNKWTLVIK